MALLNSVIFVSSVVSFRDRKNLTTEDTEITEKTRNADACKDLLVTYLSDSRFTIDDLRFPV